MKEEEEEEEEAVYMSAGVLEGRHTGSPGAGITGSCKAPETGDSNSNPVQEQDRILTTEPALQPLNISHNACFLHFLPQIYSKECFTVSPKEANT